MTRKNISVEPSLRWVSLKLTRRDREVDSMQFEALLKAHSAGFVVMHVA